MAHPEWDGNKTGPSWRVEKYFGPINKNPIQKKKFNEWSTGWVIAIVIITFLAIFVCLFEKTPEYKRMQENSDRSRYYDELDRKKAELLFQAEQASRQKKWDREHR